MHILCGHLAVRHQGPGDVVALGGILRVGALPAVGIRGQVPAHEPGPGRVVDVILIRAGAEDIPGVELPALVQVQVVLRDELPQVRRAQAVFLGAEGVLQVEAVHAELVGHDDHRIVGHPPGHPVMPADGLHPPDLVLVIEGDAVGLVGAVLLQQGAQAQYALPRRADVGQHQHHDVLLADAAGHILLTAVGGLLVHHGHVRRQHPGIGGDGLRGGHAHVGLVDARGGPDAAMLVHAGAGGVAHGVVGQVDLQVGDDALVLPGLILGLDDDELLHVEVAVIGAGDHGGAVVAGIPADENCCAGHNLSPSLSVVQGTRPCASG